MPLFYAPNQEVYNSVRSCIDNNNADGLWKNNNSCVYNTDGAVMLTPDGGDLVWRIVRIAEDGSIRLILDTNENQLFMFQHNGSWGLGENFEYYTSEYLDSPIWLEMEDFVKGALNSKEISKLYTSKICNVGLINDETQYDEEDHGIYIDSSIESLNCLDNEKIETSISLLTASEANFASTYGYQSSVQNNNKSYFNTFKDANISRSFLTMTGSGWMSLDSN